MDSPEVIKSRLPLYPSVRRLETGMNQIVSFSTVIRKRFDGQYYLKICTISGSNEAKSIHELHGTVYRILMLEKLNTHLWVLDNDQVNEVKRLL